MSQQTQKNIQCPKCHHMQSTSIWTSVNVTLDPKLEKQILSRELFAFKCKHCGYKTEVVYSFLYHNMHEKIMIWIKEDNGDKSFDEPTLQMTEMLEEYTLRIVKSVSHLIEKIRIFNDAHNDKAIELLKLSVLANENESLEKSLFYESTRSNLFGKRTIVFVEMTGQGEMEYTIPWNDVESNLNNMLNSIKNGQILKEGEWLKVDQEYALKIFTAYKKYSSAKSVKVSATNGLKGKPNGTYQYHDEHGNVREGWMAPEKIKGELEKVGAKKLTKVFIKGPWEDVKEELWEVSDEIVDQFSDKDANIYALCTYTEGEPKYHYLSKRMWINFDEIQTILSDPNISEEEKKKRIDRINRDDT